MELDALYEDSERHLYEPPRVVVHKKRQYVKTVIQSALSEATTDPPATSFAHWLEINALRLADQPQPFPTLDELASAGLPDEVLTPLRELVAQGEAEDAVVAALLHVFLQHGPKCQLPRNASRNIRSRFQRQVSATLAAAVEPLIKTWCATG